MNLKFNDVNLDNKKGVYWEFHFKVIIDSLKELQRLLTWYENENKEEIAVSMSGTGHTLYPIVTLRLHEGTRKQAIDTKDKIINNLKKEGFHIYDKLQAECSVYDTFPEEDKGWIL